MQQGGGENEALRKWTGQTSAPVAVYDNLPPACHWLDLLMLAERLAPDQPLVPLDCAERLIVLGPVGADRRGGRFWLEPAPADAGANDDAG